MSRASGGKGGGGKRDGDFETSAAVKPVDSFDSMGLSEDLIRGIYAYGTWS